MVYFSLRRIKKSYKDKVVLKNVNLDIMDEILGIVGDNGAGKSTLMNIIYGLIAPDEGSIDKYQKDLLVGYLNQSDDYLNQMEISKDTLKDLSEIGIAKLTDWSDERFQNLSGGEITKLKLSKLFNEHYDLLILDEPTNHLDYQGVSWLIERLKKIKIPVVMISHDRYFLDMTVTRIAELNVGEITIYEGNYSFYRDEKQRKYTEQLHHYENEKKKIHHIEMEVERLKKWSHLAHRDSTKHETPKEYWRKKAKAKDKQIKQAIRRKEKLLDKGVKKPIEEQNIYFNFSDAGKHGKRILEANALKKRFDDILFENSSFYIGRDEIVGIIGPNGCGKTTLIKMILGEDSDYEGDLWISPSLKIGYLSQGIDYEDYSIQAIISKFDRDKETQARMLFSQIGINSDMLLQKINTLSFGERVRVKLIFIILKDVNILILDEPTNHLDLHSREQLEETLESYDGTLLIVSHDRYLLERLTDTLLVFENKQIKRVEMGLKEYYLRENEDKSNYNLMVIENRITEILSSLGNYKDTNDRYQELLKEYNHLLKIKKDITKLK